MAPLSVGIAEYAKRAFFYRWNLLAFLGSIAVAGMSPYPDAIFPLVAAAEIVYIAGLVSNSRFRQAIDADVHQANTQQTAATTQRSLQDVVAAFPEDLAPSAAGLGILALPLALLVDVVVGPLVHLAVAGRPVPRLGAHLARVRRIATSCLVGLLFRNGVDGRLRGEGEAGLASHPNSAEV